MGRKCGITECASESTRAEDIGVTFHKIPLHTDIRPKWMSLCRIPEDRQNNKVVYICSRHFLKADFCNFKGRKYMLKQGVLPSVFPWNKGKLAKKQDDAQTHLDKIKKETPTMESGEDIKKEVIDENIKPSLPMTSSAIKIKEELPSPLQTSTIEEPKILTLDTPTGPLTFTPDEKIEALDCNQWCPARIVEVDYQENEVLVHFENNSNKHEWICMNSNALRAIQEPKELPPPAAPVKTSSEVFDSGERCTAFWNDTKKLPATIQKKIDSDTYEVLFDDGIVKTLKGNRIFKCQRKAMQSSPLFDPSKVTKQERRDRKRKLNVTALLGKKTKGSGQDAASNSETFLSPSEEIEPWFLSWENGKPVGEESAIETSDGMRKSYIVPDPRLPTKWQKHLSQRVYGTSAGKWDTFIVSPEGKKFRTRAEIRAFIEENPHLKLSESMFDFCINRRNRSKRQNADVSVEQTPPQVSNTTPNVDTEPDDNDHNSLKIPMIDNAYKCPIEGCGKNFRRENLAQMHVKHYHPEYTKFLDSTPNVADLAYARTVGESLDRSPGPEKRLPQRQLPKTSTPKIATPKLPQSPSGEDLKQHPKKDQEIIKLLNSKPIENLKQENVAKSPRSNSPLTSDSKLREIMSNTPKRDDIPLRSSRPPGSGIKTLLPVVRATEAKMEDNIETPKSIPKHLKRKRVASETVDLKPKEEFPSAVQQPESSNVIIEGGEVIKIVRMKREEIINCTCGITEEDGLMIQCELCLCWQHAYCNNIERENQVPEKYICYICQNPIRQRSSKKYFHDQDWLKNGTLPVGSYHCKDEEALQKRFEKLKRSHDLSGGMLELRGYMHTMKMKMKIAEAKNHPKLYLWSKPWDKPPLPEKESSPDVKVKMEDESMLFNLLKSEKDVKLKDDEFPKLDINTLMDNNIGNVPIIPQPEAAIESDDCKLNLLEHIAHCQSLIEQRLDNFEQQLNALDVGLSIDEDPDICPRTRQTSQMIMRDLNTLNELSQVTSF